MSGSTSPMLVLMGLRGSGKSTVGRLLAQRMGTGGVGGVFVDLDDRTAHSMGEGSAGAAITQHGEAAFRVAEARELRTALAEPIAVLALGGGTPTASGAEAALAAAQATGRVRIIYLRATPDVLRARLGAAGASTRPSLTGRGTLEEIGELFAGRDPLYSRLAARTIAVDTLAAEEIVDRILAG